VTDKELKAFIVKAKKATYASDAAPQSASRAGSKDLSYKEGEFSYLDSYYGSVQFCGQEMVWQKSEPIWGMNYWGESIDAGLAAATQRNDANASDLASGDEGPKPLFDLSAFLKESLMKVGEDAPFRGPGEYKKKCGAVTAAYRCRWTGDLSGFTGDETISVDDRAVFRLFFHGGKIKS
jgi:hypothetical protein